MSMPEALVESAAKAMHADVCCPADGKNGACVYPNDRWGDRRVARIALETVADDIRAEALRDAADAWQQGGWGNAIPSPEAQGRVALVVNMSQRTTEWLRARADRIGAGGEPHE